MLSFYFFLHLNRFLSFRLLHLFSICFSLSPNISLFSFFFLFWHSFFPWQFPTILSWLFYCSLPISFFFSYSFLFLLSPLLTLSLSLSVFLSFYSPTLSCSLWLSISLIVSHGPPTYHFSYSLSLFFSFSLYFQLDFPSFLKFQHFCLFSISFPNLLYIYMYCFLFFSLSFSFTSRTIHQCSSSARIQFDVDIVPVGFSLPPATSIISVRNLASSKFLDNVHNSALTTTHPTAPHHLQKLQVVRGLWPRNVPECDVWWTIFYGSLRLQHNFGLFLSYIFPIFFEHYLFFGGR